MKIKAISLWQPWASLISIGAKVYETRSWATDHRGPLAIHAAKHWTSAERDLSFYDPYFKRALNGAGISSEAAIVGSSEWVPNRLPLGAVVAVVDLIACWQIAESGLVRRVGGKFEARPLPMGAERAFGDYSPGRVAWELANVRRIEPCPCRGAQGFFDVELPEIERPPVTPKAFTDLFSQ